MSQVINMVSKNADFIMFHSFDLDNQVYSDVIQSVPISKFDHSLLVSSDNESNSILKIFNSGSCILTLDVTNGSFVNPFYKYVNDSDIPSVNATQLISFFLNP